MKIPDNLVGKIQYCSRGGQTGLFVTNDQLAKFSKLIGNKYVDLIMPVSNIISENCSNCKNKDDILENILYWETDSGSHGWCCAECGKVFQWG